MAKKNAANVVGVKTKTTWKQAFKRDWQLYLLLLFPLIMVIVFSYGAYPGLRMAFMDYKPAKGYAGSEWVGMKTFIKIFKDADFMRALRNSVVFNLADLLVGFPMPIILALILNELRYPRFKKVSQTILYLPHFLSWAIIGSVAMTMFRPNSGLVNILLTNLGVISEGIPFLNEKWHWAITYLLIGVWQTMGWGTILYLAAITGINGELYEAAMIDGCTPIQTFFQIVMPILKPTAITVAILNAMWVWNDYLLPYLVIGVSTPYKTIPVAVQYLMGSYGAKDYGAMMALLVLAIIPIIAFYLFCQKYIIEGVVAGAVKG